MPEAKKEWKRLAPSLIAMGILTEHDMEAFAGYCQAYARWREARAIFLKQLSLCAFCQADAIIHNKSWTAFRCPALFIR